MLNNLSWLIFFPLHNRVCEGNHNSLSNFARLLLWLKVPFSVSEGIKELSKRWTYFRDFLYPLTNSRRGESNHISVSNFADQRSCYSRFTREAPQVILHVRWSWMYLRFLLSSNHWVRLLVGWLSRLISGNRMLSFLLFLSFVFKHSYMVALIAV